MSGRSWLIRIAQVFFCLGWGVISCPTVSLLQMRSDKRKSLYSFEGCHWLTEASPLMIGGLTGRALSRVWSTSSETNEPQKSAVRIRHMIRTVGRRCEWRSPRLQVPLIGLCDRNVVGALKQQGSLFVLCCFSSRVLVSSLKVSRVGDARR